jgi:phosphoribosylamine--glycine ligase
MSKANARGAGQPPVPTGPVNVLLIGGNGREHALAWKLKKSRKLGQLWTTNPENPGLAALAKAVDVPIDYANPHRLRMFCDHQNIGLVVVGPEEPLAHGVADALTSSTDGRENVRFIFGPGKDGARLEWDKAWSKQMMRAAALPTAEGRVFSDPEGAKAYLESRETPHVVKASGLAKGKGVIVPASLAEALDAVDRIMVKREFGDAGATVVIEERLTGPEASVLALVDGRTIYVLEPCQDHKRVGDNDTGPNTGGMGAFCPGGITDPRMLDRVQREILVPMVDCLKRDGIEFRGVLYAGLMLTHAGPKVLEFNTRFGDPECQALMARMEGDLLDIMLATACRRLDEVEIGWKPGASCCVVLASKGYPDKPDPHASGKEITGLDEAAAMPGVVVFHAGTRRAEGGGGKIVTGGGRVLSVTATGESLADARAKAYAAARVIQFEGKVMRTDIGANAVTR